MFRSLTAINAVLPKGSGLKAPQGLCGESCMVGHYASRHKGVLKGRVHGDPPSFRAFLGDLLERLFEKVAVYQHEA
jgi:hypothetical protein